MTRVIVVSPVVSHKAMSGNSERVRQLVSILESLGCEVHFVLHPIREISDRRNGDGMVEHYGPRYYELNDGQIFEGTWYQRLLNFFKRKTPLKKFAFIKDKIFEDAYVTRSLSEEFKSIVEKVKPTTVICEYVLLSKLVEGLEENIVRIVDTHDRFANRNKRIRERNGHGLWWELTHDQERFLLKRFDYALAIQRNEAKLFSSCLEGVNTKVVTLDILEPARRKVYLTDNPHVIGFIGSQNQHNKEGLECFIESHWDNIRSAIPNAELHIAGAIYTEIEVRKIPGISFLGRVDSLAEYYDSCAFCINPCLTGSGLKIKSVESLTYGKPLVTSHEGAEGIEHANGKGMFIFSIEEHGFGKTCIALLENRVLTDEMGSAALEFINKSVKINKNALSYLLPCDKVADKLELAN
tara:strand:+ start:1991 stop:3220 length:1230 start_codon:yes stop_codon:yes gene_type:complete